MKDEFKKKIQSALELPPELLGNVYRVTLVGGDSVLVENYISVTEYDQNFIRLSCGISIWGRDISVVEINSNEIMISGKLNNIEIEK